VNRPFKKNLDSTRRRWRQDRYFKEEEHDKNEEYPECYEKIMIQFWPEKRGT
jgi:hypothetical protein